MTLIKFGMADEVGEACLGHFGYFRTRRERIEG